MFYYSKSVFKDPERKRSRDRQQTAPEVTGAVIVTAISKDLKSGVIPKVSSRLLKKMKVGDLKKVIKLAADRKVLAKFKTPRLRKRVFAFEFKMRKRIILKTMAAGRLPSLGLFIIRLDQSQLTDLRNAIMSGAMSMKRKLDQSKNAKTVAGKKLYNKFLYLVKTIDDQKIALSEREIA